MSSLLHRLAAPGMHTGLHVSSVAAIVTGCAVLVTAGDLGPFAPMLLACGLYLIFFGFTVEATFALFALVRWYSCKRLEARQHNAEEPAALQGRRVPQRSTS